MCLNLGESKTETPKQTLDSRCHMTKCEHSIQYCVYSSYCWKFRHLYTHKSRGAFSAYTWKRFLWIVKHSKQLELFMSLVTACQHSVTSKYQENTVKILSRHFFTGDLHFRKLFQIIGSTSKVKEPSEEEIMRGSRGFLRSEVVRMRWRLHLYTMFLRESVFVFWVYTTTVMGPTENLIF